MLEQKKAKEIADAMTENTSWGVADTMVRVLAKASDGIVYSAQHADVTILCYEGTDGNKRFKSVSW